ncbi:MAG: zinc ribbon domain-containing protein [Verrucomicrobiaceae bacterium]|jgi:predicted nucleic acid-binding Zn ribbon protein|nr:zinc ribbon domain-containing protein [Verrucomicrobiales bacterium]MDB2327082.1 zinc ribbon domain-containing protein [bacterium]NCF85021.1 zinc ribbon domain-containing protein [Verrucomicrobiaceae bacterium]MDC0313163.1 zinc ribbon domain-containing protein [Verrucomicrobiales bacterium]MDC0504453.1 zinc ribbon domain-containing protein [Verrucomicrobiales bacterium]
MATYVYESVPGAADEPVERFEIRQSMMDDALDTHPDTGKPIRRVITGGYLSTGGGTNRASPAGGAC